MRLIPKREAPMPSSEQKVKAVHPKAAKKRYSKKDDGSYHLIWSGYPVSRNSIRLGNGKTASDARLDAAKKIEQTDT